MVLEKVTSCFGGTLFDVDGNRVDSSAVNLT
jgi:hypothetical protein